MGVLVWTVLRGRVEARKQEGHADGGSEGTGLLSEETVELVVYLDDGSRKVIGEAVVETIGSELDVTGVVTDEEWKVRLSDYSTFSLAYNPVHDETTKVIKEYELQEVAVVLPLKFKGKVPYRSE